MGAFEDLALIYDSAIDWTQRLNRELPFIIKLLKNKPAPRILDLACGTGRHAIALAQRGYAVIGLDSSSQMIATAKQHAKHNKVNVQFLLADMSRVTSVVEGKFDLILCLGNSLALLPDHPTLQQTLNGVHTLLKPDGHFAAQVLNFEEIRHSGFRFFPIKAGRTKTGEEAVFMRFFEPLTTSNTAQLVFTGFIQKGTKWETRMDTQQVLQLDQDILRTTLQDANFNRVVYYGGYDESQFTPLDSRTLVFVALSE